MALGVPILKHFRVILLEQNIEEFVLASCQQPVRPVTTSSQQPLSISQHYRYFGLFWIG